MVKRLTMLAQEVTRVSLEGTTCTLCFLASCPDFASSFHAVGTEGKLGGQAVVDNVGGVWKDLQDNV